MYYFIVNTNSRSGKAAKIWQEIQAELDRSGVEYEAYISEYQGHTKVLASELTAAPRNAGENQIIVAVGGDGTLNEVVDGLHVSHHITLGYIPTGSGNDFARSMKISKKPLKALHRVLHPRYFRFLDYGVLSCDTCDINHRRFVVSTGIGFDADVCRFINGSKLKKFLCKIHLSKLSYIVLGLRALMSMKSSDGHMVLDSAKKINLKDVAFVATHIHKSEGGGFRFAPKADPCDGQFEICVVSHANRLQMIPTLVLALFGLHTKSKLVRMYQCHELSIHMDRPSTVHADGEVLGNYTDVSVNCRTKQLRFIV